jgi:transposase
MKEDGRTLDHRTLGTIRLMAIKRVREGERPSVVIASYGFHRSVIYRWMKAAAGRGHGLRALASRRATGRPRKLTARQARQVFQWVNGHPPLKYGFDTGLWTRSLVRERVQQQWGITLSLASIGALLARLGLTTQQPLQRAYQRDPQAIEHWQRETYPALARRAKAEGANLCFWDESGFHANAVQGKTWGIKGHPPVVAVPGQRQRVSAASAVSPNGAFWFATYRGALTGELFVEWLKKLMKRRKKPMHLIVDGLPAHKKAVVKEYVVSTQGKLTLRFLPGYAPELNPDELVWSYAKRTGPARRPLQTGEKLEQRVQIQLAGIGKRPALIRSFFKHPSVAYLSNL